MGKTKDKKTKRVSDVFLEMSPSSSFASESPEKRTLQTDTHNLSPRHLEMLTSSSEKPQKKHRKRDLPTQESENESYELQTEGELGKGTLKKRAKLRDEKVTHIHDTHISEVPSNNAAKPDLGDVDGSADEMSPLETPVKKKKKKEKLGQTEENVTYEESESDASRKKKRSKDKYKVEMDVTVKSDESEMTSEDRQGESGKKKKKKKEKRNKERNEDSSVLAEQMEVLGSAATAAQSHEMEDINVTTEPEENQSKKRRERKKNKAAHKETSLTTQERQTVPKTELEDDGYAAERVQIGTGFAKRRNSKGVTKQVDERLLEELKQFIPTVESREPEDINKMIHYDLPRYKEFKKRGIPLNRGRFTTKENETLMKNVDDFLALTGIDNATKLFFTHHFKEEQEQIKRLKKMHRFFAVIADGIPRSCHDVYARGRRVFDGSAHKGKFSKTEIHQLRALHTLHGNNWKKISELTGRSALSLEKRYSQLNLKEGYWSKAEVQRLLRSVRDHIISQVQPGVTDISSTRVSRQILYQGLPWRKIAAQVETRSWAKCREKWMSVLAVKMSSGAEHTEKNSDEIKVKLIKAKTVGALQHDGTINGSLIPVTALSENAIY
ncbi:uncharacterized protein [Salminus brasiliensis]|uniref:uncharacterized protein isoform X2 n=1 Tax=Salminus brasiliensis TaxID=930266 RepID=UPI003B837001